MQQELERRILEDFDDVEAFSVYADYLTDQGDPRGELIRLQLALEDGALSPIQRQSLQEKEKALLGRHAPTWLGPLAELLLKVNERERWLVHGWRFQRGFLAELYVYQLGLPLLQALRASPEARFLRKLSFDHLSEEVTAEALADLPLAQVRVLQVGNEEGYLREEGRATALAEGMPRLEELVVHGRDIDTESLFALSLPQLRELAVTCTHRFATGVLAANASLARLESLRFEPHALEPGDPLDGYLRLQDIELIARSPHLRGLKHLTLYCCTAGDEGCRVLVQSGLLGRLSSLDLSHGEITDEGARQLAGCPELGRLQRLDLTDNGLTEAGIALLKASGVAELKVIGQSPRDEDREYLNNGCCE